MAIDIRWFKKNKQSDTSWKCYRLTIGNSVVHSSIYWLDIICEDWEGNHPSHADVMYAYPIWSFWTYKKFRKKKLALK